MNEPRLAELLVDRALGALAEDDARELEHELAEHPERDDGSLERAAATLTLVGLRPQPLPAALRARLADSGARWAQERRRELAARGPRASSPRRAPELSLPAPAARSAGPQAPDAGGAAPGAGWFPWALAAAAALVAILGWTRETPAPAVPGAPAPGEARSELVASAADLIRLPWGAGPDATGAQASGDVVWSDARQEGYMRMVGLAPNDPSKEQYQLWIFDEAQSQDTPIDGGVFDVRGKEVVVPIDPKLHVGHALAFAVTVERPGGVVVSDRSRIALVAGL